MAEVFEGVAGLAHAIEAPAATALTGAILGTFQHRIIRAFSPLRIRVAEV